MIDRQTATRLMNLNWQETSGVDHPANAPDMDGTASEGWMVLKAMDVQALDNSLTDQQQAADTLAPLFEALLAADLTSSPSEVQQAAVTLGEWLMEQGHNDQYQQDGQDYGQQQQSPEFQQQQRRVSQLSNKPPVQQHRIPPQFMRKSEDELLADIIYGEREFHPQPATQPEKPSTMRSLIDRMMGRVSKAELDEAMLSELLERTDEIAAKVSSKLTLSS